MCIYVYANIIQFPLCIIMDKENAFHTQDNITFILYMHVYSLIDTDSLPFIVTRRKFIFT